MTELWNLLLNNKTFSVENRSHTEFLELYEPIHRQLSRFCRAISGNTEDAKDLLNDTIFLFSEKDTQIISFDL